MCFTWKYISWLVGFLHQGDQDMCSSLVKKNSSDVTTKLELRL